MTARKFMTALLLIAATLTAVALPALAEVLPASGDLHPVSGDALHTSGDAAPQHTPRAAYGELKICVLASCEDDPATEAAIKRAAETALLRLGGVAVSDFLEESSVLISFVAFKERDSQGMQTGRIVYSFAYGTPDLDFEDDIPIGLPRYLYHEPVIAAREMLEKTIGDKIHEADRDFFHFLRTR